MQNAHLRLGLLEYHRITEKTSARIRVRVASYIGEDKQAHLIGVFGNDSDIGAITAAVHEKANFTLTFPDGAIEEITLGEHASCYRRSVILPGRKHPVRHLLAISEQLHSNGSAGRTILSRDNPNEAWAWLAVRSRMIQCGSASPPTGIQSHNSRMEFCDMNRVVSTFVSGR